MKGASLMSLTNYSILRVCPVCRSPFRLSPDRPIWLKGKVCSAACVLPTGKLPRLTKEELFWAKVNKTDGCWLWLGKLNNGYGSASYNNIPYRAQTVAWLYTNGPIPTGLIVCHNCPGGDNKACVRPDHMFLGTRSDNAFDWYTKQRLRYKLY